MIVRHLSLLVSFILIMGSACKSSQTSQINMDAYKEVALQKLGEGYECIPNSSESLMLCTVRTQIEQNTITGVKFLVYDQENQEIIYESNIGRGSVNWYSEFELAIFRTPGIMAPNQTRDDYTQIYNLNTKQKVKKSSLNENKSEK